MTLEAVKGLREGLNWGWTSAPRPLLSSGSGREIFSAGKRWAGRDAADVAVVCTVAVDARPRQG